MHSQNYTGSGDYFKHDNGWTKYFLVLVIIICIRINCIFLDYIDLAIYNEKIFINTYIYEILEECYLTPYVFYHYRLSDRLVRAINGPHNHFGLKMVLKRSKRFKNILI